jgi:hypothetical protein
MTDEKTEPESERVDTRSKAELARDIERNRDELAATLDAIEYKLNLSRQAKAAAARAGDRIRLLRDENPTVLAAGAVAVAAAVGGLVWLGVRAMLNRR